MVTNLYLENHGKSWPKHNISIPNQNTKSWKYEFWNWKIKTTYYRKQQKRSTVVVITASLYNTDISTTTTTTSKTISYIKKLSHKKKRLTKKTLLSLRLPPKSSFTSSKLRFWSLRKSKNSSFYSSLNKTRMTQNEMGHPHLYFILREWTLGPKRVAWLASLQAL